MEIDSQEENNVLEPYILDANMHLYIGMENIDSSNPNADGYYWRHSNRSLSEGFTCWYNGEPSLITGEKCGMIYLPRHANPAVNRGCDGGIGWDNWLCTNLHGAICESDPIFTSDLI